MNSYITTSTTTISIDYVACVNNINLSYVSKYPNYPNTLQMKPEYTSVTGPGDYMLWLPTNFTNNQSSCVHTTFSGSFGLGINGPNNITFHGSELHSGFTHSRVTYTWLFTFYCPASSCPYYTFLCLTTKFWVGKQLRSIIMSLCNKDTSNRNTS